MHPEQRGYVAGEPIDDLRRALGYVRMHRTAGEIAFDATIPGEEALPFVRALMRVEAELLLHEADRLTAPDAPVRTDDERRADAFTALVLRVEDAHGA